MSSDFASWTVVDHDTEGRDVLGRSDTHVVLIAGPRDTLENLAREFLGDAERAWVIAEANGTRKIQPGDEVVIPLRERNRLGIYADAYQAVPVLTYHRFGARPNKLTITPETFDAQLRYLREHGYHVVPLHHLAEFVRGQRRLPRHSVVITIDDGYQSTYDVAFPILRKHRAHATVFVYSDYIGHGGLTWAQIEEMVATGLIDIQPHSKTHSNLALRQKGESEAERINRVEQEVEVPQRLFAEHLGEPMQSYAYPFGDFDDAVVASLKRNGYTLGFTVIPGSVPAFGDPYALRRTMVFGDRDMAAFARALRTEYPLVEK